jgi:hypothetical protein
MRTIVTAALQRQYSQTELIFWITPVFAASNEFVWNWTNKPLIPAMTF